MAKATKTAIRNAVGKITRSVNQTAKKNTENALAATEKLMESTFKVYGYAPKVKAKEQSKFGTK